MIRGLLGPLAGRRDLGDEDLEAAYAAASPSLRANFVVGLDGVVAVDGLSGGLGGPADRAVFAALRAVTDVVLVAAGTVRAEGYGPAWLRADRRRRRVERGQAPLPVVAVVTGSADIDPTARFLTERRDDQPDAPRPIVFTAAAAPAERVERLARLATVVTVGAERVDLPAMLDDLRARGHGRVLCEGGPGLFGQLLAAGLVDELCLTHSPVLGGPGNPVLAGDPRGAPGPATALTLASLLEGDGLLLARYVRRAAGPDEGRP